MRSLPWIAALLLALGSPASALARGRSPNQGRLGELGKGGVALISVGAAGVGTGIGFVAIGKRPRASDEFAGEGAMVDFRPAGAALVAFCGVALLGGIGMLAVDRARARRHATSWTPLVGRGFVGLSFHRRF